MSYRFRYGRFADLARGRLFDVRDVPAFAATSGGRTSGMRKRALDGSSAVSCACEQSYDADVDVE